MASDKALAHRLCRNEFPHRDGKYFFGRKRDRLTGGPRWGISSGFPLANHLALPGSESVFGLFQGPPVCRSLPGAQAVKNLPAMQETWVRSLSGGDPLEKNMATHSNILAWRIPWTEEPGGLQSIGPQRVRHD